MTNQTEVAAALNKTHRRWLTLVLIFGFTVFLFWFYSRPKHIEVTLLEVSKGLVEQTIANTRAGTVKACRRAKLSPSVGGQIVTLPVAEGDFVTTGQLLLELWNQDLRAQVELARNELSTAKTKKAAACAQKKLSESILSRRKSLLSSGGVSQQAVDEATAAAKMHKANCQGAESAIKMQNAHLKFNEALVAKTQLFAPFDGIVANISAELNEFVTPSPIGIQTPPAVDLIDNNCFYVEAPIDEVDAPMVTIDLPVRITLDSFSDQHFHGQVRRMAPFVLDLEKQARTVDVEVKFSNTDDHNKLLAGYSADVEIIVATRPNTLNIPSETLLQGNKVWLYLPPSQTIELREIETGLSNWDVTEVLQGLKPGEQIVLPINGEILKPGVRVSANQSSATHD